MSKRTPEGHGIAKAEEVESEFNDMWSDLADYVEALEAAISVLDIALTGARDEEARAREPMED